MNVLICSALLVAIYLISEAAAQMYARVKPAVVFSVASIALLAVTIIVAAVEVQARRRSDAAFALASKDKDKTRPLPRVLTLRPLASTGSLSYPIAAVVYTVAGFLFIYRFFHSDTFNWDLSVLLTTSFVTLVFQLGYLLPLTACVVTLPAQVLGCYGVYNFSSDPSKAILLGLCWAINVYAWFSREQSLRDDWLLSANVQGKRSSVDLARDACTITIRCVMASLALIMLKKTVHCIFSAQAGDHIIR